jgi:hypothetical protein
MREQNLLRDVMPTLLERGRTAANRARTAQHDSGGDQFELGRAHAYYEVLSTLQNQLNAFGITPKSVGLPEDLDLERELL